VLADVLARADQLLAAQPPRVDAVRLGGDSSDRRCSMCGLNPWPAVSMVRTRPQRWRLQRLVHRLRAYVPVRYPRSTTPWRGSVFSQSKGRHRPRWSKLTSGRSTRRSCTSKERRASRAAGGTASTGAGRDWGRADRRAVPYPRLAEPEKSGWKCCRRGRRVSFRGVFGARDVRLTRRRDRLAVP
jgi:hypothetical protein